MNLARYAGSLLLGRNRLSELTYFVTDTCNFRCRHCFIADADRIPRSRHLRPDEIAAMGPGLAPLGRVYLSGGEPFTRTDLDEILIAIARSWKSQVITVPTNGFFSEAIQRTITRFGSQTRGSLRILYSLNTLHGAMDEFTGVPDSFEQWRRSISAARRAAAGFENISVGVITSYNDSNQETFADLIRFVVEECGIADLSFGIVRPHGTYAPRLDLGRFSDFVESYYGNQRTGGIVAVYQQLFRETLLSYYLAPRFMIPCVAGTNRVVLAPDGAVYPCEQRGYPMSTREPGWRLGNIRDHDYDFGKLMRGTAARRVRQEIRVSRCHCNHACDLSLSLLNSRSFQRKVLTRSVRKALGAVLRDKPFP